MKKISLLLCAAIAFTLSAVAQTTDDTRLSAKQWKHSLALLAQIEARDAHFAETESKLIENYGADFSLDDLNDYYHNRGSKWEKIYSNLKAHEGQPGTIKDLKSYSKFYRNVQKDVESYIAANPASPQELAQQNQPAANETQAAQTDEAQADNGEATTEPAEAQVAEEGKSANGSHWQSLLNIVLTLLSIIALYMAHAARKSVKALRKATAKEIDKTNANLQQLGTDASQQIKALSLRITEQNSVSRSLLEHRPVTAPKAVKQPAQQQPAQQPTQQQAAQQAPAPAQPQEPEEQLLYLARADEDDVFVHVSKRLEPGNSVFALRTTDGKRGKFSVIDDAAVHRFALMMPSENLMRACSGENIQVAIGRTRIITDRSGEAVFEDGQWRVAQKAIIHYE